MQELPFKTTGTESDGHQTLWLQQGLDWGQTELEEVGESKTSINKTFDLCLKAAACFALLRDSLKTGVFHKSCSEPHAALEVLAFL